MLSNSIAEDSLEFIFVPTCNQCIQKQSFPIDK